MSKFVVDPNEYIYFEPDQVLTNDHLNQLFGYLDQQERWTRNKLIGIGIVCGFDLTYDSKAVTISISGGCGITSQGYLIKDCGSHTYTDIIIYTPKPLPEDLPFTCNPTPFYAPGTPTQPIIYQLLDSGGVASSTPDPCANCLPGNDQAPPKNPPEPLSSINLSGYVVVLFLEVQEKDLKNCDTQDCNNNGEKVIFNLIPLLVPKGLINGRGNVITRPKEIKLKRYNVPYTNINNSFQVLEAFIKLMDLDTLDTLGKIEGALSYCYHYTASFFPGVDKFPFTSKPGKYLQLEIEKVIKSNPLLIQYCYDFLNDLILAYYEFREAEACADLVCCADECKFPLHLVLGLAESKQYVKDPYRQYFIKATGGCQDTSLSELEFLLTRMQMMIKYFFNPLTDWKKLIAKESDNRSLAAVKITPSQYEKFPLSERAIPYYYYMDNTTKNLYGYWNFHKTTNGNAAFNLSYNAEVYNSDDSIIDPLKYDIEKYNFFRIEGHIGEPYQNVLRNILSQRLKYNLPFDVVAVSAELLNSNNSTIPTCNIVDLETDFRLLIMEFLSKLFLCIYKFSLLSYDQQRLFSTEGSFGISSVANDIDNAELMKYFKLEFSAYKFGDFISNYTPFDKTAPTIGNAYVALVQKESYANPVSLEGSNLSYMQAYSNQFSLLRAVDVLFYMLLNTNLSEMEATGFVRQYDRFNALLEEFMRILERGQENASVFDGCGCDCLVVIAERILALLREYKRRVDLYRSQLNFLNYFRKHPGLEHKAGVPKGGTFVLVYHEAAQRLAVDTAVDREVDTRITIDKEVGRKLDAGLTIEEAKPALEIAKKEYTFDENTIQLIRDFVDNCDDGPPDLKKIILKKFPPVRVQDPFLNIVNGAVIADFYIPYLCCSDCSPVAYIMDNVDPLNIYNVTGGGSICENFNADGNINGGFSVKLSGSDTGVNYQLFNGSSTVGSPVPGTGKALDFGIQNQSGTYTVVATSANGKTTATMNGNAVIAINPPPAAFNVTGTGSYCEGGAAAPNGLVVGLDGSEQGVNYQLSNGQTDVGAAVHGTGDAISFGTQTAGTYTVFATNTTTKCTATMAGNAVITANPAPKVFGVTGGGTFCQGDDAIQVGLDGSETGVSYQLLVSINGAAPVPSSSMPGTGGSFNFNFQPVSGVYTVVAFSAQQCPANMSNSVTITILATPSSQIGQPTAVMQPSTGTLLITLTPVETDPSYTYNWTFDTAFFQKFKLTVKLLNKRVLTITVPVASAVAIIRQTQATPINVSLSVLNGNCGNSGGDTIDIKPLILQNVG